MISFLLKQHEEVLVDIVLNLKLVGWTNI